MLKNTQIKPITGTFVNMLISDTGIVNAGLKEWENDFKMMKAIGMDHLFVIRTEWEQNGRHLSAEDPRSTTYRAAEKKCHFIFIRQTEDHIQQTFIFGPSSGSGIFC